MPLRDQALAGTLGKIDNITVKIVRWISYISAVCVAVIMFVAFIDAIGSKFFKTGIPGAYSIIQYAHVPLVFLATGFVTLDRGQTYIDLLSSKFPKVLQKICQIFSFLLGAFICCFVAWRSLIQMQSYLKYHNMSSVTGFGFPLWPFSLILSIGFFLIAVTFLWSIVRVLAPKVDLVPEKPDEAETAETESEGGEA